jgi:hypothetical protein
VPNRTLRVALGSLAVLAATGVVAACGGDDSSASEASQPTATVTVTQSTTPSESATPPPATPTATLPSASPPPPIPPATATPAEPPMPQGGFPCDPGGGFPKPSATCPYGDPVTGTVTGFDGSTVTLKPFHTYYNDAEGKAYAKKHHIDYPFLDDHYDAPDSPARTVEAAPDTICTGIIAVGYRDPMKDRKVPCSAYVKAVSRYQAVTSALWFDGQHLVQLSELFRP